MYNRIESIIAIIITIWILAITTGMTYIICTTHLDTTIFAIGPNRNLYIFGICIDTLPKYGVVITFCFVNSGIRAMSTNVLRSWVINDVQDKSNKRPINHRKAYILSSVSVTYNWFDFFMYMNILLSQIDLFVLEIIADLIMTCLLTNYYLKQKTITEHSHYSTSLSEENEVVE
jgi:hypothetical protein